MYRFTTVVLVGLLTASPGFAEEAIGTSTLPDASAEVNNGPFWSNFTLGITMEGQSLCELCAEWKPAWAAFRRGAELVASPMAERIPTVELQPWVRRTMASLALGAARTVSDDPQSIDPIRFVSHDESSFVGVVTPSDQLRKLSSTDSQPDQ